MKLTANSAFYGPCPGRENFTHIQALKYLKECGFDGMDINLAASITKGNYLQQEDWRNTILGIRECAQKYQMEVSQSHLPFYNFADPMCIDLEQKNAMFQRSIEASGLLGVKWAVFHAGNALDSVQGFRESKRRTIEFLKPYMEVFEHYNVGIAVENLFIPHKLKRTHRYCMNVEEVCDLVDSLGTSAGVCWDFGHANLMLDNQVDCLRLVGKRLKVIHVHDNDGKHDDHQIPYSSYCTVPWNEVLPVLKEIEYDGNFNFEVMASLQPEIVRESLGKYLAKLGRYLITMVGE